MILPILLFILIILVICVTIVFLFYILLPTLEKQGYKTSDSIVSATEKYYEITLDTEIKSSDSKALVLCSCKKTFQLPSINFKEQYTCFMVKSMHGSGTDCKYACIGLGDCAKVCPQKAISIVNRTAVVSSLCIGCGKCLTVCPQNIIKLVPKDTKSIVLCNNNQAKEITSCSDFGKTENVSWNASKGFKIWEYCYRILKGKK
jgi:Fe-S-cluster-containing hydrogenase component 2